MKTIKENFKMIVSIICLIGICYPLVVNFKNPEITQMQLFLKFWWLYLLCVGGIVYGIASSE